VRRRHCLSGQPGANPPFQALFSHFQSPFTHHLLVRFSTLTVFALLNARILLHLQYNPPLTTTDNLSGITVGVVSESSEIFRVTVRGAAAKVYSTVDSALQGLKHEEVGS
jgi:hypothetical protein